MGKGRTHHESGMSVAFKDGEGTCPLEREGFRRGVWDGVE